MENTFDDMKGNGIVGTRFADARRKDETKNSGAGLFVGAHGVEQSCGLNTRPRGERPQATNQRDDTGDIVGASQAEFMAEECCGHHAPGYGFAVLVDAVLRNGFESVGKGVAEIEDFAQPGFAFVSANDASFDFHVARDEQTDGLAIATKDLFHVFF